MRRHTTLVVAAALTLVPAVAACGGNASANGSSGSVTVSTQGGATSLSGGAAGHSFSAQLRSLGALLSRAASLSGSQGSAQIASTIGQMRRGLRTVSGDLQSATLPSAVQTQKQQLVGFLDKWNGDLARAQGTAQAGRSMQAIQQVQDTSYRDLKSLVDVLQMATN